ncbi:acyltransferase family protein [Verrucosispora sp. CWR15]|uniref:Acyltransferase family protein n=1 Tax=Verrucosispora sioxanthis TaxID=2499994 RepID=A0A6M1L809_9ACTN|nr:acyltransferase family protein [Verrucosispora sioxanthis]NEE65259.1 acyltransferase family protein [Verrucosispora sioxanthis]NGM14369.1 acyltransferase family protein [Verrucosispora sioxanthis]
MSGRHIAHWPVRDPLVDGLRAFAVAAVVLGHWLVTGLVLDEEGALNLASPLTAMPALAPASWVLQTLGLFFFAAGHASARSADRHPGVGWVRHRLRRLLLPAVALLGTGSAVLLAAAVAGVADDTLSVALTLAISPLWFLAPCWPWWCSPARCEPPYAAGAPRAARSPQRPWWLAPTWPCGRSPPASGCHR